MEDLVQLIAELHGSESIAALSDVFQRFVESHGFHAFTLGSIPLRQGKVDSSGFVLHSTLPMPFQDAYREQQMQQLDPVIEIIASRFQPFTKSSLDTMWEQAPHKAAVNQLADEHEIGDGLLVPINTAEYSRGVVMLTNTSPDEFEACLQRAGHLLHLAALAVMDRAVQLGFGVAVLPDVRLTERERECLELCALGKTYDQIAQTLGIAERTVRFHLGNTYDKLEAKSSSHAVTKAVQLGLIRT